MICLAKKEKCTGCKMCADICPYNAISFGIDEKGFWYPNIDEKKCVECGLCAQKCPALNLGQLKEGENPLVYAAWSKNSSCRHQSTSGGLFWEIAKIFIENGGAVAGCRYADDYKSANHFLACTMEELEQLRGSKYFQSDTEGIYKAVRQKLKEGKEVLFCGTPCQNAALSMYLGKNQTGITYMDFICRSINSPLAYEKYIEELEKQYGSKVVRVHMKNKKTGWQSLALQVLFDNGDESHKDKNDDWWMKGFLQHDLYTRESCYECDYRILPRKTVDITVGDFWGIAGESTYDMFQGISVVMLNTSKGISLFEKVKGNLCYRKRELKDVIPGNMALKNSPEKTEKSELFFNFLKENPFSIAVMRSTGEKKRKKKVLKVFEMFKDLRQDQKKYKKNGVISIRLYLYYNYFCKNIEHRGKAKIIPYKNTLIQLHPSSKIILYGDQDLEIGWGKMKGSKAETYIQMWENSVWHVRRGGRVIYLSTIVVSNGAVLDTGFFSLNIGSLIGVDKKMVIGDDVMTGRNIVLYDSDMHQIQNDCGEVINPPEEVVIGEHVWLGIGSKVLKGVTIGAGAMVGAGTVVTKNMPEHAMVVSGSSCRCVKENVNWKREKLVVYDDIFKNKKLILYGYGILGKGFERKYGGNIVHIVDNHSNNKHVLSFNEFNKKYPKLDEDYAWVIAAPNYYDELYAQVKKKYPDVLTVVAQI